MNEKAYIRSAVNPQKGDERNSSPAQSVKIPRQVLRPKSGVRRGGEPDPTVIGSKVRLARKPVCHKGDGIIAKANEPHAGEFICADCGKHLAWLSHSTAKFLEEAMRHFGALDVIIIGTAEERRELRNRDYELPDGVRVEIGNPAFPPRLYLSRSFGARPIPKGWERLSTMKTQATIIAVGKSHRDVADAVAFFSERYGKTQVQIKLKQRQETPAVKRLDDDGNELNSQDTGDDEMRASDMFPSKYLKSSDVKDRPLTATISYVAVELVGQGKDQERKPVLYFEGTVKPMVLNKTNAITLDNAFGDSEEWAGHKVRIGCVETTYNGRAIDGIRVKPVAAVKPPPPPLDEITDDQLA